MTKRAIPLIAIVLFAALLCTAGCTTQPLVTGENATPPAVADTSLLVYSGAGLKKPMSEIGEAFTDKYGIGVEYTFAGSGGTLMTQMELSRKATPSSPAERRTTASPGRKGWSESRGGTSPTTSR